MYPPPGLAGRLAFVPLVRCGEAPPWRSLPVPAHRWGRGSVLAKTGTMGGWCLLCQLRLGQPEHLPTKIKEMENVSMPRATLAHGEIIKCVHKVLGLTWTCFYHAL